MLDSTRLDELHFCFLSSALLPPEVWLWASSFAQLTLQTEMRRLQRRRGEREGEREGEGCVNISGRERKRNRGMRESCYICIHPSKRWYFIRYDGVEIRLRSISMIWPYLTVDAIISDIRAVAQSKCFPVLKIEMTKNKKWSKKNKVKNKVMWYGLSCKACLICVNWGSSGLVLTSIFHVK